MLSTDEFTRVYWAHYIALEKEFSETFRYVSLAKDNYETYSEAYLKLLLQIGSELDIMLKIFCKLKEPTFKGEKISEYRSCINQHETSFATQKILVHALEDIIQPWKVWKEKTNNRLDWWTVYNKVKHERTNIGQVENETKEYYKFANLKNCLYSLSALYQVNSYIYYQLAQKEQDEIQTPLPGSRVFRLTGEHWDNVCFYGDNAFYINGTGHLIMRSSKIHY